MKDSLQQQTTLCGSKGNRGQYTLESPPPAAHISSSPEIVGAQYGWVRIISAEKRWNAAWNHCYVLTQCTQCGSVQWTNYTNLRAGKTRGCQSCSRPRQVPLWLDRRLTAAKQRCENPKDANYYRYGARGIRFCFDSVTEAGLWILQNLTNISREYELDRIDNDRHYERGNLRFISKKENLGNRQRTVLSQWDPDYWPYARTVVTRMLSSGMTREEIIKAAELAVYEKRKGWRTIRDKLKSMTYEMPDHVIVLPYRAS